MIAGRIVMDEAFEDFKQDVLDKYRNPELQEKINSFISDFWQKGMTLTQATKAFVNHYFGQYGVVMIDGDDSELKQSFLPVVKEELSQKFTFHVVNQTNQALSDASYHQQVYLRECNLFYINENGRRIRIETVEKGFQLDQSIYSAEELIEKAEQSPESFSPNALLRPVYQEMILPNIMYLGGGGEMAYWMQLKSVFKHLNLDFPILKVRDSYVILSDSDIQFMEELSYDLVDLKTSYDALAKEFVKENATEVLNFKTENDLFELLSKSMRKKTAVCYDNTQRFLEAELTKIQSQLDKIEKKLIQDQKKRHEKTLKQIKRLRDKVYPENGFQERYENILQYIHLDNFVDTLRSKVKESDLSEEAQVQIFVF